MIYFVLMCYICFSVPIKPEGFKSNMDKITQYKDYSFSAICSLDPNEVVSQQGEIVLRAADFCTLRPKKWVNDNIIMAFLSKIAAQRSEQIEIEQFLPLQLLKSGGRYLAESVFGQKYFEKNRNVEFIFLPIAYSGHWTLAVVFPNISHIEYFDSKREQDPPVLREIHNFMEIGFGRDFTMEHRKDIPIQYNEYDCGVYVMKFGECLMMNRNMYFSDADMMEFRREIAKDVHIAPDVVTEEVVSGELVTEEEGKAGECVADLLKQLNITSNKSSTYQFDRQTSIVLVETIKTPFIGTDERGLTQTFNTEGDWRNCLSLVEILKELSDGKDKKSGWKRIEDEVRANPMLIPSWLSNADTGSNDNSPFKFQVGSKGNFLKLKKLMRDHYKTSVVDPHYQEVKKNLKIFNLQKKLKLVE